MKYTISLLLSHLVYAQQFSPGQPCMLNGQIIQPGMPGYPNMGLNGNGINNGFNNGFNNGRPNINNGMVPNGISPNIDGFNSNGIPQPVVLDPNGVPIPVIPVSSVGPSSVGGNPGFNGNIRYPLCPRFSSESSIIPFLSIYPVFALLF